MNACCCVDTLELTESLKESGFSDDQAKGITGALKRAQEVHLETLATKQDIKNLEIGFNTKFDTFEAATKQDIKDLRNEMDKELTLIKWMLALIILVTVVPALKSLFG